MEFLTFWAAVSVRSVGLAAAASVAMAMAAARVKSPAARHAVWTLVTAGMLSILLAGAALLPLPVRMLRRQAPATLVTITGVVFSARPAGPMPVPARSFPWPAVYAAGLLWFGGRFTYGYALTRRLVHASSRAPRLDSVWASARVTIPLTVGWLRPKILLPANWDQREPAKLDAVLGVARDPHTAEAKRRCQA
jgi:hypothetical protein